MAIGRVAGPLLHSDLDRQGVDLQFSTNSQPLLYLDFANFRAAINSPAAPQTFAVNGNVALDSLRINGDSLSSVTNSIRLGGISNVKITGGSDNFIMTTDGAGNLAWKDISEVSGELNLSAENIILGNAIDGSIIDYSAYRYWTPDTSLTDAVDNLNQVMLNVYQNTYVGVATFNSVIRSGPSPLTVQFTSTHLGNPDTYLWEFVDANTGMIVGTSNQQHPSFTFANELGGDYTVYFKASNSGGTRNADGRLGDPTLAQGSYADSKVVNYIKLYTPLPVSSFTLLQSNINSGSVVNLTNTSQYAQSYVINWGDGTTDVISSNTMPGGPSGGAISHQYNNLLGDTQYHVTLEAFSATAGPAGETVTSSPQNVNVFSTHIALMVSNKTEGNNQHQTLPYGLQVTFTNNTTTHPGTTAIFPGNRIEYTWGDGSTTNVNIGSGQPGDLGMTIMHPFVLLDPEVEQIFTVTMRIYNGHSSSPFASVSQNITVHPAPTSLFTGVPIVVSDRVGDNQQTGYIFTDMDGINRSTINFTNQSINANTYEWNYGDGVITNLNEGDPGTPTGGVVQHTYGMPSVLPYTVSLLAHGPSSINPLDDTLTKATYIEIKNAPAEPVGLSTKTISITITGSTPLLASNATNNSSSLAPAAGQSVNRITTMAPVETSMVVDAYNAANGILSAVVNGVDDGVVTLTGNNDTGTNGALVISADTDSHTLWPTVYPSRFYNVFSGKISKPSVLEGYNTYKMTHSITGSTNELGFVKDTVVTPPTLRVDVAWASTAVSGTLRYISGVPYFRSGGSIYLHDVTAENWIGQTYLGPTATVTPLSVSSGTVTGGSGNVVELQNKTYAQIDGAPSFLNAGIPIANTGKTSATKYTLGAVTVAVNSVAAVSGRVKLALTNVNGTSSYVEVPTLLNVYSLPAIVGFDETIIPVDDTLGGAYTDDGKRIIMLAGANPVYDPLENYFLNHAFVGAVNVGVTDEAIVRYGTLAHNVTNFNTYLPQGPDASGRAGTQYFKFAFRRSTVANFTITYSGKISGLWIAAPGTVIDQASSLNGWVNGAEVYAGAGVPGDILPFGNGSLGCAKSAGDVIPVATTVTNGAYTMTLGNANSSDATGNQILVSIALNATDFITSISIS